jgi:hypothetical protein
VNREGAPGGELWPGALLVGGRLGAAVERLA